MKKSFNRQFVFSHPVYFLAAGFGSGLLPKAPGTWGTVTAIPIYLLLQPLAVGSYLLCTLIMVVLGIYFCHKTSADLGVHDHSGIVYDEIAGYLVTMIAAPSGIMAILLGFMLFRFFDIVKPWPIAWCDKTIGGGFGIMLDDIVAGVLAAVCLQGIYFWL